MPIHESRLFPYGVYRRIWRFLPLYYESFFPTKADLSIFFNYVVPPRIAGKVMTFIYDMTFFRFPETMDARNRRRLDEGLRRSIARSDRLLTISEFSIVSGVFRVITDKARRDELIGLGHYQENKYTWEASADRLRAVCREVLEEK